MEKEQDSAGAACCGPAQPADDRLSAPLPQAPAALPARAPELASAPSAGTISVAVFFAPRSHAPPSPTGLSPPALA